MQQRITEEPLKHCPECKGKVNRLISAAGIIFKGSGFHITDYSKKSSVGTKTEIKKEKKKEKKAEKIKKSESKKVSE